MISQGQGCFVVVRERWEAGRAAGRRRVRSMLDADLAVGDGGEGYPQGNQLPLRPAALRPVAELLLGAVADLFPGLLLHRDHLMVNLHVDLVPFVVQLKLPHVLPPCRSSEFPLPLTCPTLRQTPLLLVFRVSVSPLR